MKYSTAPRTTVLEAACGLCKTVVSRGVVGFDSAREP